MMCTLTAHRFNACGSSLNLTLFVYDGDSWLPVAGGGGGGGTPGTGITQIIGNQGIDADEIAGVVTLDCPRSTSNSMAPTAD